MFLRHFCEVGFNHLSSSVRVFRQLFLKSVLVNCNASSAVSLEYILFLYLATVDVLRTGKLKYFDVKGSLQLLVAAKMKRQERQCKKSSLEGEAGVKKWREFRDYVMQSSPHGALFSREGWGICKQRFDRYPEHCISMQPLKINSSHIFVQQIGAFHLLISTWMRQFNEPQFRNSNTLGW